MLPSQAEIGAASGTPHDVMVAVVSAFGAAAVIGLPFGFWHRRGLVGSLYRVGGAAVFVRLVFAAPLLLVMSAWMGAVVIAVLDGLLTVRGDLVTERRQVPGADPRQPFGAGEGRARADRRTFGPAFSSQTAYQPPPPWGPATGAAPPPSWSGSTGAPPPPYGGAARSSRWAAGGAAGAGYAPPPQSSAGAGAPPAWGATNSRRAGRGQTGAWGPAARPGGSRPVLAWMVALVAMLGVAAFALASHADLLPQNGFSLPLPSPQSSPPASGQSQGPATTNQGPSQQAPSEDEQTTAPTAEPGQVCYRTPVGSGSVCFQRHRGEG